MLTKWKEKGLNTLAVLIDKRIKPKPPNLAFKLLEQTVWIFENDQNPKYQDNIPELIRRFEKLKHPLLAKYMSIAAMEDYFNYYHAYGKVSVSSEDYLDQVYTFSHEQDFRYKIRYGLHGLYEHMLYNQKMRFPDNLYRAIIFHKEIDTFIDWDKAKRWVSWIFFVLFLTLAFSHSYLVMGRIGLLRVGLGTLVGWYLGLFLRNDEISDLATSLFLVILLVAAMF
jgi:hypothetical protein